MESSGAPPPFDPELARALATINQVVPPTMDLDQLLALRSRPRPATAAEERVAAGTLAVDEVSACGADGDPEVELSIYRDPSHPSGGPAIYYVHGGGMVNGHRRMVDITLPWIDALCAAVVSVEYRLAPEHPDPAPIRDCYAGLAWTAAHAVELGFDPDKLVVAGQSAGGGLAAGCALMARDRHGPALAAQVLVCPMIDDRNDTRSSGQIDGVGVWDRRSNAAGWQALLGDRRGTADVSAYAAPARAGDLSNLPPAYVDCGSAEVFRDEAVAYASAIWAAGGVADLHVWAGGFHGFDMLAPDAAVSISARNTRTDFLRRILEVRDGATAPVEVTGES